MAINWITVLNILLLLVILVASLSIPEDMMEDAAFIGDAEDNDRKIRDFCCFFQTLLFTFTAFTFTFFTATRECFNSTVIFNATRFRKRLQRFRQRYG